MCKLPFLGNKREGRSGATTVEFALVTPMLFTLMLGTVEFGALLYSYSAMQLAASRTARQMAVHAITASGAQTATQAYLPQWARPYVATAVTQSNATDPGTNVIRIRLTGRSDQLTIMPMLTRLVPWNMTADASIKQELPYED